MKKKITKKVTQQHFEKDINTLIENMDDGEMISLLKELESTQYWVAISKYVQERLAIPYTFLLTASPIQSPDQISIMQGRIQGLLDLHDLINHAKKEKVTEDEESQIY